MDIKIAGITEEIMKVALGQAKDGRLHILGEMAKALTAARGELGEFAPRIEVMQIPTDKIREVIGTGGKVIREIVEKTGAKINIEDDGTVKVASSDGKADRRRDQVDQVDRRRAGSRRDLRGHRGQDRRFRRLRELLRPEGRPRPHLAARQRARRTRPPTWSRKATRSGSSCLGFDERGKVRLSMKVVDQETGKELAREKKKDEGAKTRFDFARRQDDGGRDPHGSRPSAFHAGFASRRPGGWRWPAMR